MPASIRAISGGPLLNVHGELVGVNVAIRAGAPGISASPIPVDKHDPARSATCCARGAAARRWRTASCAATRLEQVGDSLARSVRVERVDGGSPPARPASRPATCSCRSATCPSCAATDVERALLDNKAGDPHSFRRAPAERRASAWTSPWPPRNEFSAPDDRSRLAQAGAWQLNPVDADLVTARQPPASRRHGGRRGERRQSRAARAGIKKGDNPRRPLHQWETVTMENVAYVLGHPDLQVFSPLNFTSCAGRPGPPAARYPGMN